MRTVLFTRGSEPLIVESALRETEVAIRAARHLVSVSVILTVILPEANRADLECSALAERLMTTARTAKRKVLNEHVESNA
jgi:hypothetical protein